MKLMENWSLVSEDGEYVPIEDASNRGDILLCGHAYAAGKEAHVLYTGPIIRVGIDTRFALNAYGNLYELGEPEFEYLEFCRLNDRPAIQSLKT
jgi:hypothetical protein